jgi:serine/threonine-protein kinase
VVALRPDWWDGYDELGNFYGRQGRYSDATKQYRKAIELTPDNAQVYGNLGGNYINSGDPKLRGDAEQALKKSIELGPSYAAYANLGNLYLIEQRYAESAAATEKALQLQGSDYLVWDNLKLAYEWLNDKAKADAARGRMLDLLEETVKLKPQDATAQSILALVYAQDKNAEKASAHIQTSLALAPDDPDVLANVGEAYEIMGNRPQALNYIHKALKKGYAFDQLKIDPALQGILTDSNFTIVK